MIFPENARICFIGDSITAANKALSYIVDAYHTQFPEKKVKFFNCGVSGAQLYYPLKHFEDDIKIFSPTHAVIAFGANDCHFWWLPYLPSREHYDLLLKAYDTYKERLAILCERLEEIGVKDIILCTPVPYNEYGESEAEVWKGCAAAMLGYSFYVKEFAKQKGYKLCDYNSFLTNEMQKGNEVFTKKDRVHPSDNGYFLMAKCFLETQGVEIGKYKEIPEYLTAWREKTADLRDVHYVENNILENREISQEEKFSFIKEFLKKDNIADDFIIRGNKYFANYNKTEIFAREIEEIYDRDILNM